MLPPVVVLFMIILLRTIVMDVALLATSLELRVSPSRYVRSYVRSCCVLKRQDRTPLSVLSMVPVLSLAGTNASVT